MTPLEGMPPVDWLTGGSPFRLSQLPDISVSLSCIFRKNQLDNIEQIPYS
jgi:hypothetical protein